MRLLLLAAAALALQAGPRKPEVQWDAAPKPIVPGREFTVTVAPFMSRAQCTVWVRYAAGKRSEVPCGTRTAAIVLPPLESSTARTVTLDLSVCLPGGSDPRTKVTCYTYSKEVPRLPQGAAPAHREGVRAARPEAAPAAPEPAPAPAPAPAAPPKPEAGPIVALPSGAARGALDEELLAKLTGRPVVREVRGLDGALHSITAGLDDKDDRYRLALLKDDQVRKAYDGWESLDDAARLAALRRASALQAQAYGIDAVPVDLGPIASPRTLAHYSPSTHAITVDPAKRFFKDPDLAFNVITHESRHSYQHQLVRRLDAGQLSGEEAALAATFKKSFDDYCCEKCKRACDYHAYRAQAVEQDAFEHGEAATVYLGNDKARATYDEYLMGRTP